MQPHEKRKNWLRFVPTERLLNQFSAELYNSQKRGFCRSSFRHTLFCLILRLFSLSYVFSLQCIEKELPQTLFKMHLRQPLYYFDDSVRTSTRQCSCWVRNIAPPLPCRKPCRAEQIPVQGISPCGEVAGFETQPRPLLRRASKTRLIPVYIFIPSAVFFSIIVTRHQTKHIRTIS